MRFQTPQFIEVPDKIFGPLTAKQFIYLAGGGGVTLVLYLIIPIHVIAFILMAPVIAFSLALAFYKKDGRSFVEILESAFYFTIGSKLYIWEKTEKKIKKKEKGNIITDTHDQNTYIPKLSDSKLKDLAWSLDIHDQTIQRQNDL